MVELALDIKVEPGVEISITASPVIESNVDED